MGTSHCPPHQGDVGQFIEPLMCAWYYQWCPPPFQSSSQVNCCLTSGELCGRHFRANSLLTLPAIWNSRASVPEVDYVGGRQKRMEQRREQSLSYTRKAWWSLQTAGTCMHSRKYLGVQTRPLRGMTGIKQKRLTPGQQDSCVNKDCCSPKTAQRKVTTFKVLWPVWQQNNSKMRGKFLWFLRNPNSLWDIEGERKSPQMKDWIYFWQVSCVLLFVTQDLFPLPTPSSRTWASTAPSPQSGAPDTGISLTLHSQGFSGFPQHVLPSD